MAHVRSLAALKSRTAGTSGESRAIRYVKEKLRDAGLDVWAEPFLFSSYTLERATLRVAGVSVQPVRIVFDPYGGAADLKAAAVFVTAEAVNGGKGLAGLKLSGRIVVTTKDAQSFRIAPRKPAAIVFLSDEDFEKAKGAGATEAELLVKGRIRRIRSANLVAATRTPNAGREIILSAHIDSAGTPGAQDNASGVAVLLELARSLPKLDLPFRLRFVFFGAEEIGLLGSKAYLGRHRDDLQRCKLLFNMDSIGGKEIWIDMRDGVVNLPAVKGIGPEPREYLDKATTDFTGRWTFIGPATISSEASNVPAWLQNAIVDSGRELGYRINQGRDASSDHRTFAAAGIVATDIAIGGIKTHTPEDVPAQIAPESLEQAARIVTGVVTRSVVALNTPPATQPMR